MVGWNTSCNNLVEDGLGLAFGSVEALVAFAQSTLVVTGTTSGAVSSVVVTLAEHDIVGGGALLKGAVGSTES